jgi:hypothetical protein
MNFEKEFTGPSAGRLHANDNEEALSELGPRQYAGTLDTPEEKVLSDENDEISLEAITPLEPVTFDPNVPGDYGEPVETGARDAA